MKGALFGAVGATCLLFFAYRGGGKAAPRNNGLNLECVFWGDRHVENRKEREKKEKKPVTFFGHNK